MQLTPLSAGEWHTVKSAIRNTKERESALMPKLTKRGRIVLIYAPLTIAILSLIVWISARVWWTGTGYCIGTLASCFH